MALSRRPQWAAPVPPPRRGWIRMTIGGAAASSAVVVGIVEQVANLPGGDALRFKILSQSGPDAIEPSVERLGVLDAQPSGDERHGQPEHETQPHEQQIRGAETRERAASAPGPSDLSLHAARSGRCRPRGPAPGRRACRATVRRPSAGAFAAAAGRRAPRWPDDRACRPTWRSAARWPPRARAAHGPAAARARWRPAQVVRPAPTAATFPTARCGSRSGPGAPPPSGRFAGCSSRRTSRGCGTRSR